MTDDEKRAIQEKARRNQQQWEGGTFQHFASEAEKQEHLRQVREAQQDSSPF